MCAIFTCLCYFVVRDVAALNIAKAREKRESYFNKGSKLREFEVGDRVLYRVPGLTCKLSDSWIVVQDKKGLVNYRFGRDVKNGKTVHVNSIKKYVEQININRLDVVIDEDVDSTLLDGACTGYDESKLGEVLDKHVDVSSEVPGNVDLVEMSIDTGNTREKQGIISRSHSPWYSPLGPVREKQGIISRSHSPWCSPLGPVREKQGIISRSHSPWCSPLGPVREKQGIISRSHSPWCSPLGPVRKANGL